MFTNSCKVASRATAKKAITLEAASLARFADGSSTCTLGNTSVLVTAVCQPPQKNSIQSFVPLVIDYRLKAAAAGRIPMTRLRREIGVSEKEMLTSRQIDRSIRTGFPKGFNYDTQIICNILADDGINSPDILAINGASASLSISDIPWKGPIGAVRVGLVGENLVLNPTKKELDNSRLNLVISANSSGNVTMLEGFTQEPVLMPDIQKAIKGGIKECQTIVQSIQELQRLIGKPKRMVDLSGSVPSDEQINFTSNIARDKIKEVLTNHSYDKISRDQAMKQVQLEVEEKYKETFPEANTVTFYSSFSRTVRAVYTQMLDETKIRCDGRKPDELRQISCEVDLYKPLHGSAIFQRGQTQVLCSTTFDSPDAAISTSDVKERNFMLHYEFPPFATNEIGKVGMPNRREVGHGALAEKGIRPIVPEQQDMTIRLNCEVLESNGSSSMASVCAGSMSLMDAGVNIKEHVAGVAMGLFKGEDPEEGEEDHILTDILGFEDYIGDMDFKIAGTRKGVTSLQLDVKPLLGVPPTILYKAMQKAHTARGEIINKMDKAIREPRKEKKANHPVIKFVHVPAHKKTKLIGFGGANLKKLIAKTGVRVSTESDEDESPGFNIFAPNQDAMQEAEEYIQTLLEKESKEPVLDFNGIYTATIQEVRQNGVMVTLYPNMSPALLPNSQLDIRPISHPSALNLEVGQQIQIKYFGRDPANGHMRLSRKSLLMTATAKVHRTPLG